MQKIPPTDDLRVFCTVVRKAGFAAAAQELAASPAYVSKRIRLLEQELGVPLLHRTTRRVAVTDQGERVFHWAQRILDDMDQLLQEVAVTRREPRGLLRVSSSFGFGRQVIAPALSRLVQQHPGLQVRLEVFDRLVDVAGEGFDLDVRVGDEIAPHLIARRLADNHRVLCAAPSYLARRGTPRTPAELMAHACIRLRFPSGRLYGWEFVAPDGRGFEVQVAGAFTANDQTAMLLAAEAGLGLAYVYEGQAAPAVAAGRLVRVLQDWLPPAEQLYLYYPSRRLQPAGLRALLDLLRSTVDSA